jgi:hypothetical protein
LRQGARTSRAPGVLDGGPNDEQDRPDQQRATQGAGADPACNVTGDTHAWGRTNARLYHLPGRCPSATRVRSAQLRTDRRKTHIWLLPRAESPLPHTSVRRRPLQQCQGLVRARTCRGTSPGSPRQENRVPAHDSRHCQGRWPVGPRLGRPGLLRRRLSPYRAAQWLTKPNDYSGCAPRLRHYSDKLAAPRCGNWRWGYRRPTRLSPPTLVHAFCSCRTGPAGRGRQRAGGHA